MELSKNLLRSEQNLAKGSHEVTFCTQKLTVNINIGTKKKLAFETVGNIRRLSLTYMIAKKSLRIYTCQIGLDFLADKIALLAVFHGRSKTLNYII